MLIHLHGSLGDEVALTGVLREYRRAQPHETVALDVRWPEVFEGHPALSSGTADTGGEVWLPLGGDPRRGHLAHDYAARLGVTAVDVTPQIVLTQDERAAVRYDGTRPLVAIDTWAGWPSRRWPIERWHEVARALVRLGMGLIEVGAATPDCDGARRSRQDRFVVTHEDFVGRLSVRQTAAVIAQADLYVGSDSGLAHVAAAVGTRSVVIYGPVPYWERAYPSTVPVSLPGGACRHGEHCACIDKVSVEAVLTACATALRLS